MSSTRTLRFAVGTALFALGGCQKDKAATETPEPTETMNVAPVDETPEPTDAAPEPEHTNVGPKGEPESTDSPAPAKSPE